MAVSKNEAFVEHILSTITCKYPVYYQYSFKKDALYTGKGYVADFAIPDLKVAIEVDSDTFHRDSDNKFNWYHISRYKDIVFNGWKVISITDSMINAGEAFVRSYIIDKLTLEDREFDNCTTLIKCIGYDEYVSSMDHDIRDDIDDAFMKVLKLKQDIKKYAKMLKSHQRLSKARKKCKNTKVDNKYEIVPNKETYGDKTDSCIKYINGIIDGKDQSEYPELKEIVKMCMNEGYKQRMAYKCCTIIAINSNIKFK